MEVVEDKLCGYLLFDDKQPILFTEACVFDLSIKCREVFVDHPIDFKDFREVTLMQRDALLSIIDEYDFGDVEVIEKLWRELAYGCRSTEYQFIFCRDLFKYHGWLDALELLFLLDAIVFIIYDDILKVRSEYSE